MKKEDRYLIAAHPIQQMILELVVSEGINETSLRKIAEKIGAKKSPQQIKFHLGQMVKYGFLDIVGGKYKVGEKMKKS